MNIKPDYNKLCAILKHFEGYYPNAYQDTGKVWTMGFGSTFHFDKNRKVQKGDFISQADAMRYVEKESESIIKYLNYYIKVPLNDYQAAAVVDYVYNRGIGNFLRTNLDELINANPLDPKIKAEFIETGLWDRLGNKLWGLGRRRRTQWHLYSTGVVKTDWLKWGN